MDNLGITKGEYKIRKSGQELFIDTPTMEICRSWSDSPKYRKHFELFCDAGNTAQKCGLLPSELLRQRDELKEALADMVSQFAYETETDGGFALFTGGLSALEGAFYALGLSDPITILDFEAAIKSAESNNQ